MYEFDDLFGFEPKLYRIEKSNKHFILKNVLFMTHTMTLASRIRDKG